MKRAKVRYDPQLYDSSTLRVFKDERRAILYIIGAGRLFSSSRKAWVGKPHLLIMLVRMIDLNGERRTNTPFISGLMGRNEGMSAVLGMA